MVEDRITISKCRFSKGIKTVSSKPEAHPKSIYSNPTPKTICKAQKNSRGCCSLLHLLPTDWVSLHENHANI